MDGIPWPLGADLDSAGCECRLRPRSRQSTTATTVGGLRPAAVVASPAPYQSFVGDASGKAITHQLGVAVQQRV